MNNIIKLIAALLLLTLLCVSAAFAESGCEYFDRYGDHDWIYGRRDATCQQDGEVYRDCSVCGTHDVQQTLPATDHAWSVETLTKEPTCTESGENTASCLGCGKLKVTAVPALGHSWTEFSTVSEPDCVNAGEKKRNCQRCGTVESQAIEALGHDWGKVGITVAPTCQTEGEQLIACSRCELERTEPVGTIPHSYGDWTVVREASCASTGLRSAVCSMCRASINEAIERSAHEYGEWVVTLEPTGSAMGRRYRKCEVCGATNEEDFYPEGTLYRGMHKNDAVFELQQMLLEIGFIDDEPDGLFGKNTEQAVKEAQDFVELEVTGVAYPETIEAIRALWQTFNEINVTLEFSGSVDHCQLAADEDGNVAILMCEEHRDIMLECAGMYGGEMDIATYMEIAEDEYAIWYAQLQKMISMILQKQPDAAIEDAVAVYLDASYALIDSVYAGKAGTIQVKKTEAVRGICLELCELLHEMK